MNNQSQVTPVIRVENTDIPVTIYQNKRVITTDLLAQVYGTEKDNIKMNFTRNQNRFEEGKHYFKLEGKELGNFKLLCSYIHKQTRSLILWTERGAARHAKMLDTDQAWDIFDKLESAYFEQSQPVSNPDQSPFTINTDLVRILTDRIKALEGELMPKEIAPQKLTGNCTIRTNIHFDENTSLRTELRFDQNELARQLLGQGLLLVSAKQAYLQA